MIRTLLLLGMLCTGLVLATEASADQKWLEENGKEEDVKVMPSGWQYKIIRSGPDGGNHPMGVQKVKLQFKEWTLKEHLNNPDNPAVVDNSYARRGKPARMTPETSLTKGMEHALLAMKPGDEWEVYVPPALAFKDNHRGSIYPGAVILYRIHLLEVEEISKDKIAEARNRMKKAAERRRR